MRRIGIYGGSFNPVHCGHIAIAQHLVCRGWVDEVWMVRSPRNPLKPADGLLDDAERLAMLRLAVRGRRGLHVSTVEDDLPTPSYTIDTLRTLSLRHPDCAFHLAVGADNWAIFDRWRAYDEILRCYHLLVYPRPGCALPEPDAARWPTVRFVTDAPLFDVSSTDIRRRLAAGLSVRGLVPPAVGRYIAERRLYASPRP